MKISTIPTALPELVFAILSHLYQLFDFFQLPKRLVEEEIAKMMSHQFPQTSSPQASGWLTLAAGWAMVNEGRT
jgi:hypothetical protein